MSMEPFLNFFRPESMSRMAELAQELSGLAVKNVADNERDIIKTTEQRKEVNLANSRPSEVFGQTISDLASQSRKAFINALTPLEKPANLNQVTAKTEENVLPSRQPIFGAPTQNGQPIKSLIASIPKDPNERDVLGVHAVNSRRRPSIRPLSETLISEEESNNLDPVRRAPEAENPSPIRKQRINQQDTIKKSVQSNNMFGGLEQNPFFKLAESFLRTPQENSNPDKHAEIPQFQLKDFIPTADNNFGIPKGEGCLPFISEMMQAAYGDCVKAADEKTFDAWGDELRSAILTGKIDLMKASQETCKRGAERQQCGALRKAVSTCDVMGSLQIGSQLQRAMKRCEEMGGIMDQNPLTVLEQLNSLVGGEFTQGFLNKFLSPSK
ncbi:hypothetical protein WR25_13908 [Diploscapter pachys]|uniref:Uncharacterized protein n=1 Tax=Diploscapter pachys TaxID=2018661 RepID=A0A2A2K4Z6_9BILA|nr:hypothetical protein WR25_13908 [Diploscapter pachys]